MGAVTQGEEVTADGHPPAPGESQYWWKCMVCGESMQGNRGAYLTFCGKHSKANGCSVVLVDADGNEVAKSVPDAERKGLFPPKKKPYQGKTSSSKAKADAPQVTKEKVSIPRDGQALMTGYFKTERVELDVRLHLYRQLFIQEKLIPPDTTMGDFLLGCVETLLQVTNRKIAIVETKGVQ